MYYLKQDDYDKFKCIAKDCPASCCIGWQIVIDEESLEKYERIEGKFADRICRGIDFKEGVFYQNGRRCAMLNDNGLCDLQTNCGEDMLCYTCSTYPRHLEEFEDVRELSLALSCPEAARMAVDRIEPMTFIESEDDTPDDFDEFDYMLYSKLVDARGILINMLQDREVPIIERMERVMAFSRDLQECIDEDRLFDMDDIIDEGKSYCSQRYIFKEGFDILYDLERLDESWTTILKNARVCSFDGISSREEIALEQILVLLLYTYFCGAVYDDEIFSKAGLAIYSGYFIYMIYRSEATKEDLPKLAEILYRYAREVEHSDPNLDALEEYFQKLIRIE